MQTIIKTPIYSLNRHESFSHNEEFGARYSISLAIIDPASPYRLLTSTKISHPGEIVFSQNDKVVHGIEISKKEEHNLYEYCQKHNYDVSLVWVKDDKKMEFIKINLSDPMNIYYISNIKDIEKMDQFMSTISLLYFLSFSYTCYKWSIEAIKKGEDLNDRLILFYGLRFLTYLSGNPKKDAILFMAFAYEDEDLKNEEYVNKVYDIFWHLCDKPEVA